MDDEQIKIEMLMVTNARLMSHNDNMLMTIMSILAERLQTDSWTEVTEVRSILLSMASHYRSKLAQQ